MWDGESVGISEIALTQSRSDPFKTDIVDWNNDESGSSSAEAKDHWNAQKPIQSLFMTPDQNVELSKFLVDRQLAVITANSSDVSKQVRHALPFANVDK